MAIISAVNASAAVFLRIDRVAHHLGIDGDVLQCGECVVGLFDLGCAGK
ncbi:hypothetical protein [Xanthomonas translucens]|nr:hypothetical protein [Xanthomonas translucens]